ncbi:efflux RND transporter periplasmic adaptor subunit [Paracidobacterium acidisoli]|uniref:Efflux RND transporter periplasmic adaptor subunit n=1 Tax=Paracidobacterium acidisoli TaxID=2303751 RepID=A0A372IU76_9BACT|nr:efflux RND transporter periplasmic adaptor subunit [Paracidobacterium acidisoli]MBT9329782.1 efflux RND transporter periplasmic adaptor subunit [Paracidobacterium acidisoli]
MARAKARRINTAWIWLISAVAILIIFYAVHLATRSHLPILTAVASRNNLETQTSTNGKVEPQVNFEAHAPFPGVIKTLYVHEGEQVAKGKLLLSMDDTDARSRVATALAALRTAEVGYQSTVQGGTQEERLSLNGDLEKARIDRDQAQQDVQALQKLQLTGAASASEVNAAKERLAADNSSLQVLQQRKSNRYDPADLARAKASLDDAQAAYAAAQEQVNQANVRAPFAGTVYSLPVSGTEFAQQGSLLLSLADLAKLQVRAYFDEPEIGRLKVGQPIVIHWDARPTRVWHGHVLRVPSTIITYGTRNVGEVLVSIDDADGLLLPNTNVRVTVTVASLADVLTIPREALHIEQGSTYVYRIDNGKLNRIPVNVGTLNLTEVQITSGLKEGDIVALSTTNGQPLGDGLPVEVVK